MDFAQNELETALVAASQDATARPRFYEILLRSQVLVIHRGDPIERDDSGTLPAGAKLALEAVDVNGTPHTVFFTSDARLAPGTCFLGLACPDFLRLTSGSHLALNPGSAYGKYFTPAEVASLLAGSQPNLVTTTLRQAEQRLIGQPRDYPHVFVQAVARYLATEPAVERAFLAQHFIASIHEESTLLVAVDVAEPDFSRISASIGAMAADPQGPGRPVDIMRVDPGDPGYFASIEPIYTRRKRGFLAKLFG
jgi:hypothetical protein